MLTKCFVLLQDPTLEERNRRLRFLNDRHRFECNNRSFEMKNGRQSRKCVSFTFLQFVRGR